MGSVPGGKPDRIYLCHQNLAAEINYSLYTQKDLCLEMKTGHVS